MNYFLENQNLQNENWSSQDLFEFTYGLIFDVSFCLSAYNAGLPVTDDSIRTKISTIMSRIQTNIGRISGGVRIDDDERSHGMKALIDGITREVVMLEYASQYNLPWVFGHLYNRCDSVRKKVDPISVKRTSHPNIILLAIAASDLSSGELIPSMLDYSGGSKLNTEVSDFANEARNYPFQVEPDEYRSLVDSGLYNFAKSYEFVAQQYNDLDK